MKAIILIFFLLLCSVITVAKTVQSQSSAAITPANKQANIFFDFRDIPVRDLLALLADMKNKNLVISDAVKGTLTVRLENVSWEQALDTVLTMQNLAKREQGNVLFIAPAAEIAANQADSADWQEPVAKLIPIHYAKAKDLAALLQAKTNNLLSPRGSVTVDERTNQLWIKDAPTRLAQIQNFLQGIDIPAKQIQIAARIVNADESSVEELGLKFGTVTSNTSATPTQTDQLHMDMPLTIDNVGHFTVAIAKLGQGTLLDLELSALEREGRARIVSDPELITSNRQPALIESGQEIPYQEKTSSGATSVAFKKAVLSLKVTPEITPENRILLNLTVNQDKVDTLSVNGVPAISTQQVQSQVLLNDGETIVLGGIYEQINSNVTERIPFWSAIPVLGKLFTDKQTRSERKELLIFVTPKLVAS
jgi:type IV pilus assembly protein PilQ